METEYQSMKISIKDLESALAGLQDPSVFRDWEFAAPQSLPRLTDAMPVAMTTRETVSLHAIKAGIGWAWRVVTPLTVQAAASRDPHAREDAQVARVKARINNAMRFPTVFDFLDVVLLPWHELPPDN